MASSFSTDLKLELMVTGENAGTWGDKTNTNLNLVQQAIAGFQSISIAGGPQTTALTMDNAALSNARNAVIKLTGTITGNQIVTIPTGIEKTYIVSNSTVGAFTVEFKQAGGTGVTFAATDKSTKTLFADATNIVDVGNVTETGVQTLTNKTLTTPIISSISNTGTVTLPTATDTLVGRATTDTLTNKTLTSPKIGTSILDTNGNELTLLTATGSAVNEFTIANAATANAPELSTTGGDTNIDLKITPKGSGNIVLDGLKFPNADGSANQALVTNGSGVLSFAAVGASAGQVIQVLSATDSTSRTTTGSSYVTGSNTLSVSITPASASNKIFIIVHLNSCRNDSNTVFAFFTIFRDSTNLGPANGLSTVGINMDGSVQNPVTSFPLTMTSLDSPNTTSAITYQVYFKSESGGVSGFNTRNTAECRITCMEIKG